MPTLARKLRVRCMTPDARMLYHAYQAQSGLAWPWRTAARMAAPVLEDPVWGAPSWTARDRVAAACRAVSLAEVTHRRPAWGIDRVTSRGMERGVVEEVAHATPFGTLRRFRKEGVRDEPRVLLVAPMSGHFATLLRDTVRTMLRDHDVYVTDWANMRDVPRAAGRFGLDEYAQHLVAFLAAMGPGAHVVAICQPSVPALAAVALMAEDDHPATPASLTLMAGPIDTRIDPTAVNRLASSKPIEWFEQKLISVVPLPHAGAGRHVYPGFVQLGAFMSMNHARHARAFADYQAHLVAGEREKADALRAFYEEYLAVADLAAEFYLETVRRVFQQHELPTGAYAVAGRRIDPRAIRRTALLTIEGERDDICSVGQTLAAQDLCTGLRPYLRSHYVQAGVGHYGVFSGKRWQQQIYPVVRDVIYAND
jgi:poly(3-hydroxybutyrate) depolymerase